MIKDPPTLQDAELCLSSYEFDEQFFNTRRTNPILNQNEEGEQNDETEFLDSSFKTRVQTAFNSLFKTH
jgi:hypothetical protein